MNKVKMSSGVAAIALLAGMLVSWQSLLLVTILMLLFCEMTDNIKNTMVRVVTFAVALVLVKIGWDLIVSGVDLVINSFNKLIDLINNYLTEPINTYKLNQNLLGPVSDVVSICDDIVGYLLMFAEFAFAMAVLGNKAMKENFVIRKINEFVTKCVNYVNSFEMVNPQPMQQQSSMAVNATPMANQQVVNPPLADSQNPNIFNQ